MIYKSFTIKNFKGIQNINFNLAKTHNSPVVLLVGLNESGKTTVLEALAFFFENIKKEKEVKITSNVVEDVHDLIPKSKKDNFNDHIRIEAFIDLEDSDIEKIEKFCGKSGYKANEISKTSGLILEMKYENSQFKHKNTFFDFDIKLKKKTEKRWVELNPKHELWGSFYEYFNSLLPNIIYYPNFLFNLPDKIFLQSLADESTIHKEQPFYRNIVQDILDSIGNNLKIDTHLVQRLASNIPSDRDALDMVINKMSEELSRTIINNDYSIFGENEGMREVVVSMPRIDQSTGMIYVELKIKEGSNSYYIRERSLGFKWFFSFLLFTQYRIARNTSSPKLYFLFDEPASNLHQTAQQRILKALDTMTQKGNVSIIYTTHSHHLINPKWLESTFIVKNTALDYNDEKSYNSSLTNIKVENYRSFVANSPDQRFYYQPILDVLEYRPSNLEFVPDILMIEGKTDYYVLKYFEMVLKNDEINILPGGGSGTLSNIIRLYLAWGRKFIIILDSDKEGKIAKEKYFEEFGRILEKHLFTLNDILPEWKNHAIEKILNEVDRIKIQTAIFCDSKTYKKKLFHAAIQELYVNNAVINDISKESIEAIEKIRMFYQNRIKLLD